MPSSSRTACGSAPARTRRSSPRSSPDDPAPLQEAVANAIRLEGAYSVTALVDDTLVAFRDPLRLPPARARPASATTGCVASRRARSTSSARSWSGRSAPGEVPCVDAATDAACNAQPAAGTSARSSSGACLADPTRASAGVEVPRRACPHGRAARPGGARSRPISSSASRARTPGRHPLSKASGIRSSERSESRPLCRTHLHPAGSGHARRDPP